MYSTKRQTHDLSSKIFTFILGSVIGEVILELGCYLAVQNLSDNYLLWMFIMKAYTIFILVVTALMTLYVVSIDKTITSAKRRQRLRSGVVLLSIITVVCVVLTLTVKLEVFYDGFYGYSYSSVVSYFTIPAIICMMIFWLWVTIKNVKIHDSVHRRRFIPIITFIVLYGITAIVQGMLGRWMLLTTLVHTIIMLIMIGTIENPDRKFLEKERLVNALLERADKTKDEFVSIASHQLRTPLTSIQGYSSMVADGDFGKINKKQAHALNEVVASSRRMAVLIDDLLNVSRLQSGKFIITRNLTNLAELVRDEIDQSQIMATAHNVKLIYDDTEWDKLPYANIDRAKIGEVVANMIDNAIFYSRAESKVVISLSAKGGFIEFGVTDHGIGVPKKDQADLFTKFFRASNVRTVRPDGTGIGLFLAKKVVVEHGGTIVFHSVEGEGSTFGFQLPLDS
jgi:signal transduction histidine kinase